MSTLQYSGDESGPRGAEVYASEIQLVEALRRGDEAAFEALIEQYHTSLVNLAMLYVPNRSVAEEVAQETWLGVLQGINRFEARSSLKTWIFRILTNSAKTRGQRESRSVPFSSLVDAETESFEPAVDPARFLPADHPDWPHHWATAPRSWSETPEERLLSGETRRCIREAIAALPPHQREIITLRDVDGWSSEEVCNVLGITETNQRVLLHRARSKVRRALAEYLVGD